MIKLDDHRARNLEMMFAGTPDRDLIHELVRRRRFHVFEANVTFYPEMRESPGYMDHIKDRVIRTVAHAIADDKDSVVPAIITESPDPMGRSIAVMTADMVILVARKKEENCDDV